MPRLTTSQTKTLKSLERRFQKEVKERNRDSSIQYHLSKFSAEREIMKIEGTSLEVDTTRLRVTIQPRDSRIANSSHLKEDWLMFIGKRGGIQCYDRDGHKHYGKEYCLIYGKL